MSAELAHLKGHNVSMELLIDHGIRLYIYPLVLLIGLTGNSLSVAILTRPPMRSLPAYTYLTVLSLTDNLVLLSHLLRLWIEALTGYDVSLQHNWACKLKSVVGFTTTHYSGWLIVAMTVDRYIAVCRPFQASCHGDKKRKTFLIASMLFIFFLLTNLHFLWTNHLVHSVDEEMETNSSTAPDNDADNYDDNDDHDGVDIRTSSKQFPGFLREPGRLLTPLDDGLDSVETPIGSSQTTGLDVPSSRPCTYVCNNFDEYRIFYEYVWPWIDSTLHCWAPFIILSVLNFIIATKVVESKRTRRKLTNIRLVGTNSVSESSRNLETPSRAGAPCNDSTSKTCNENFCPKESMKLSTRKNEIQKNFAHQREPPDRNLCSSLNRPASKSSIVSKLNGLSLLKLQSSKSDPQGRTLIPSSGAQPTGCERRANFYDRRPKQPWRAPHFPPNSRGASKRSRVDGDLRLAVMLLVVSFTFLATTLPVNMYMIVKALVYGEEMSGETEDRLLMWQTICDLLMYSNHAINFFLYCATGAKFRRQLFLAFAKLRR